MESHDFGTAWMEKVYSTYRAGIDGGARDGEVGGAAGGGKYTGTASEPGGGC